MDKVQFPARLVVSRYGEKLNPPAKVWADEAVLESDADLTKALRFYRGLDCGGVPYTLTMAGLADVDRVIAERWAELEAQANPGKAIATAPVPTPSDLDRAYLAARAAFAGQRGTLERLREALVLVRAGNVQDLGGGKWRVMSGGHEYRVNGECSCPDYGFGGGRWCKHRLAAALVRKVAELEKERAESAANTSALAVPSKGNHEQSQYTTSAPAAQAPARRAGRVCSAQAAAR